MVAVPFYKDVIACGFFDRLLFVDYNKLVAGPLAQLKRVYALEMVAWSLSSLLAISACFYPLAIPLLVSSRSRLQSR